MDILFRKTDEHVLEAEEAAVARAQGLIEWAMERIDVTNKELARRLNVSQAAISQMLGLSPKNLSVKKLARVLLALDDRLVITSEKREAYLADCNSERIRKFAKAIPVRETEAFSQALESYANDDPKNVLNRGLYRSPCIIEWIDCSKAA